MATIRPRLLGYIDVGTVFGNLVSNSVMIRKSRLVHVLRFAAFALLVLVVSAFVLVQVRQHLFRHRVQLVLNDMRNLWMHPGTFDDLRHLQRRWGAFGHYDGTCAAEHCEYTITLTNLEPPRWRNEGLRSLRDGAFVLFGGREVGVMCEIVVHNNRMVLESVWFMISVSDTSEIRFPFWYANGHIMNIYIRSAPRLFVNGILGREADLMRQYEIDRAQPGKTALVHVTAQTSMADIKRLTDINLECITRFRPCVEMDELLPEAWPQFRREHNMFDPSEYATRCAADPALFAREADNIALVEVVKLHAPEDPSEERTQGATVRILESLKNNAGHPVGSTADISFGGQSVYVGPGALSDPHRRLAVGDRVFLLYPRLVSGQSPGLIDTGSCSLIPFSDTTHKSVREGIAMDPSDSGLQDISIPD